MRKRSTTASGRLALGAQGQTVDGSSACTVDRLLGSGGQGEVYAVKVDGVDLALKWYYPQLATAQQKHTLAALIRSGPPNGRFLWPIDLVLFANAQGFGYLMPLREARFKGIPDLLTRRVSPSFRALTTAGVLLADGFLDLHARGWCYRDISTGNVFFDPKTGEILICDNDNVAANNSRGSVMGTTKFMAPEVVRGQAHPSTQTDLFSLAVLLFEMLMCAHPLDGKREADIHCFDSAATRELYGTQPLFIFDPIDRSNAPVAGYQDNALIFWALYPAFVKDLFTRSFTEGLRDPVHGRVRETAWREGLGRLCDSICYCACGAENFFEEARTRGDGTCGQCWKCGVRVPTPLRIRFRDGGGARDVALNHDSNLYPHHLKPRGDLDYVDAVADVRQNPADPSSWGLRNLTDERWTAFLPDGTVRDVDPQRSIALRVGTRVRIGTADAEIVR